MSKFHCVLDTSALIKKYLQEDGSDIILELFNKQDCAIHILNVTIPEITGVFVKWQLSGQIDRQKRERLLKLFIADITDYNVIIHNVTHRNIVDTDGIWDKAIVTKRGQTTVRLNFECPSCKKDVEVEETRTRQMVSAVDTLVLSVCYELKRVYNRLFLFASDHHFVKVARRMKIRTCDPVFDPMPF